MIGLDTNVLLRWLLDGAIAEDDAPEQTAAVSRIILESGETFFVNNVVLAETVWVLRNKVRQKKAVIEEIVGRLLLSVNIETENEQAVLQALDAYREGRADFADYLIAAINRAAGCSQTLTFDRKAGRHEAFIMPDDL